MPVILLSGGVWATVRLGGFWLIHPVKFCRRLKEAGDGSGTSPGKALATALAGTLGVGNMAGVATALTAGGPGALFWMWISAICAMGVKYAEVSLAVMFRRRNGEDRGETDKRGISEYAGDKSGGKCEKNGSGCGVHTGTSSKNDGSRRTKNSPSESGGGYRGGAMYYIQALHPGKAGAALALVFAALLCINSLLTGTVVQVNSAAAVFPRIPAVLAGAMFAVPMLFAAGGGGRRIMKITASLVPALTAVFTALSLYIIIKNASLLPAAMREVLRCAFDFRPAGGDFSPGALSPGVRGIFGGILGSGAAAAIRFGVTRGIFSNEAGCGTSPTAHAAANTKSPHHQGCFGVFEVFADTIALCSLTAAVLLIAPAEGDGIPRTIAAYSYFAGNGAGYVMGVSIWLFALATVLCQCYYGMEAAEYLRERLCPALSGAVVRRIFTLFSAAACIGGAVISGELMWAVADSVISLMTAVNVICVLPGVTLAAKELRRIERLDESSGEYIEPTLRPRRGECCTDHREAASAPPVTAGRRRLRAGQREG